MISKPGLKLSREISLKIDWLQFGDAFIKIIKGGFNLFAGDASGSGDLFSGLLNGANTISTEAPVESKAVELIILSFAWSFDRLQSDGHLRAEQTRGLARDAIDKLKSRIEQGDIEIAYDFFEDPAGSKPYQIMRDEFVGGRAWFRPPQEEAEVLTYRFDHAFRRAVWVLWTKKFAQLEELASALTSPAAKALDFERQWIAYRESLVYAFNVAPVFGQETTRVSLGQLFVPLRCLWTTETMRAGEKHSSRPETVCTVASLTEELTNWVDNNDGGDWLRLVGGGPGSGKSTSAKEFACRMAMRDNIRPLFIPLQVYHSREV